MCIRKSAFYSLVHSQSMPHMLPNSHFSGYSPKPFNSACLQHLYTLNITVTRSRASVYLKDAAYYRDTSGAKRSNHTITKGWATICWISVVINVRLYDSQDELKTGARKKTCPDTSSDYELYEGSPPTKFWQCQKIWRTVLQCDYPYDECQTVSVFQDKL